MRHFEHEEAWSVLWSIITILLVVLSLVAVAVTTP